MCDEFIVLAIINWQQKSIKPLIRLEAATNERQKWDVMCASFAANDTMFDENRFLVIGTKTNQFIDVIN